MESPSGPMNLRRFNPSCPSTQVTVRRLIVTGSNAIRVADHSRSRRIESICSTTSGGVAVGWWCGVDERSKRPMSRLAPPVHPLRRARPRETHLGCDVLDRTSLAPFDQTATALDGQRCIGMNSYLSMPLSRHVTDWASQSLRARDTRDGVSTGARCPTLPSTVTRGLPGSRSCSSTAWSTGIQGSCSPQPIATGQPTSCRRSATGLVCSGRSAAI